MKQQSSLTAFLARVAIFTIAFSAVIPSAVFAEPTVDEISDPFEPVNRDIFWFNDKVDTYFFKPVAQGYHWAMPDAAERSVSNVFDTLSYPSYLVSSLIQGKFEQSAEHTGRFLINATVGVLGIFDVATDLGLPKHQEDFGTALAYDGVGSGPYIVLPFLGPSNVRDGLSKIVDTVLTPSYWIRYSDASQDTKLWVPIGLYALDAVNTRAGLLDAVDAGKDASSDFYLFAQSSYYQYRKNLIFDGHPPAEEDFFGEPGGDAPATKSTTSEKSVDKDELRKKALDPKE